MTKEQLDRIKKAYSSGLKVQIWFNGYWKDFDIRDYSMYSEPFSKNRQYRIIGSDYADIAEKRIADLEKENKKLDRALITSTKNNIERQKIIDSLQAEKEKEKMQIIANCSDKEEGLRRKIFKLEQQIEKMKRHCNCKHRDSEGYCEVRRTYLMDLSYDGCDKWGLED